VYSLLFLAALPDQFVANDQFPSDRQRAAFEATVRTYHPYTRSVGTAVVVARKDGTTYMLTAAHLTAVQPYPGREKEDPKVVELYFYRANNPDHVATEAKARVIARMPNEDLAVLAAELKNDTPVIPICPRNKAVIKLPMTVMTVGALLDGPPEIKLDTVEKTKVVTKPDKTEAIYWEANIPQQIGRSGGPMIDARGYVIGIASGTQQKKGYYTSLDEIHHALSQGDLGWLHQTPAAVKLMNPREK
jgi:S1-C subfamily serine protease